MARPKPVEPKARIHIVIPNTLYARLRLLLYSPATANKLLPGAMSEFITEAIREKLERRYDLLGKSIFAPECANQGGPLAQGGQGDAGPSRTGDTRD